MSAMRPLREAAREALTSGPWLHGSVPASFDSDVEGMPDQYGQAGIISGRVCRALLDGPLSDLSVLVQIPAVRELAEIVVELPHDGANYGTKFTIAEWRAALDSLKETDR